MIVTKGKSLLTFHEAIRLGLIIPGSVVTMIDENEDEHKVIVGDICADSYQMMLKLKDWGKHTVWVPDHQVLEIRHTFDSKRNCLGFILYIDVNTSGEANIYNGVIEELEWECNANSIEELHKRAMEASEEFYNSLVERTMGELQSGDS